MLKQVLLAKIIQSVLNTTDRNPAILSFLTLLHILCYTIIVKPVAVEKVQIY